jgi:hypothetical protein
VRGTQVKVRENQEANRSPSLRRKLSVTIAKKYRHYKAECPKLKNKEEDDKSSSSFVAGVVEEKFNGSELVLVVTNSDSHFNDKWVLLTTCIFHISPKRNWFTTYEPINGGLVLMGNDVACKTIGIGTFRIRMHDRIARTLANVRHIPDLRKILFLWTLWTLLNTSILVKVESLGLVKVHWL